jgi:N-acetylglutamate synthase-like GNAT family acetyltransferase
MRSNPSGLFVAEKNGKVIGFAACKALRPEYLGPMGTTASMRGLGVGNVLFKRCLRHMQAVGRNECHISAVSLLRFYRKTVGATVSRIFWEMEKPLPGSIPG